ncbi:MAG: efflux RND transporter periplasmic adaptor subunit [Planctomycetaceae bacterium]|nr:efflux RND transporter periplasmic adaptor subunit [Planctomycetaceae bacterium]
MMKRWSAVVFKSVLVLVLAAMVVLLMLYLDGVFSPKVGPETSGQAGPAVAAPAGLGQRISGTVEARMVEIPLSEEAPGTIRPLRETALASKVREPEKVIEVNVIAGQEVHRGDVLVKLDPSTWQNRREMAQAKIRIAQAARDEALKNLQRMKEAFDKKVATAGEVDSAKYRLEGLEGEVVAAQRALDEATQNLAYTEIRAPMDAVVVDKRIDIGDTVAPGQVLVSLYDRMQMIANVREGLIKRLAAGQEIDVLFDDLGGVCTGKISEIVPLADPLTRTFQVKVVGPCRAGVRPGMYAKLRVPLGNRKVLVIPPAAVVQVGQLTMVNVADSQGVQRRSVQLGRNVVVDGKPQVEVLAGLKPGEKVALPAEEAKS